MTLGMSDDTLMAIGRITVAATMLELMLAEFAARVLGDDVEDLMSKTGKPRRRAKEAADAAKDDSKYAGFAEWVGDAEAALDDRNRVVHAIWQVVDQNPETRALVMGGEHPKTSSLIRADSALMAELPARLEVLGARGTRLCYYASDLPPGAPEIPEVEANSPKHLQTFSREAAARLFEIEQT
jgi:hypothetical protein